MQFYLIIPVLFWPVCESNELYIYTFAIWLCFWGWDCGHSSNWQLEQGHWKNTWFHHLLPVVCVTLYMNCDRWFLRFCVSCLCALWVCPMIPGVGRYNCTQGVLLLLKAAVPITGSMTCWAGNEPLTSGNELFSYGCHILLCLNSKKPQKFLKIACKQSKSEIKKVLAEIPKF